MYKCIIRNTLENISMKCGEIKKIGEICKMILPDICIPLSFGYVREKVEMLGFFSNL